MSTPDALDVALQAAAQAGAVLLQGLGRHHQSRSKATGIDLVTEYDRRSEEAIVALLRSAFPEDTVLAEEGGLHSGRTATRRWIVDPLDGTTNFAHGLPFFVVSIALEVAGVLEVGVIEAPAMGLRFAARRGAGATLNGTPIHVSDESELNRALLATGFPYDRHTTAENNFAQFIAFQRRAQGVRRVGAAALDLALTAQGCFDGFWEMKLKPWDLAAGALLVEEAGGKVSGWQGERLELERGAIVAANPALHQALLGVLAEVGIPTAAQPPPAPTA